LSIWRTGPLKKYVIFLFQLQQEFTALTTFYEREFFQEMLALNILPPTMTSRVSDNVTTIINFIQRIMDKGFGYVGEDGILLTVL